jgi:hypothetical protein
MPIYTHDNHDRYRRLLAVIKRVLGLVLLVLEIVRRLQDLL